MHEEIQDDSTFEDTSNTEKLPKNLDDDLRRWIDQVDPNGSLSYKSTLYKYEHPKHGDRKEFCAQFDDEAPSLEEVGNKFGGGRYLLYVVVYNDEIGENKQVKSYKFKISDYYNKQPQIPINNYQQQTSPIEIIGMFKDLMSSIVPLIAQQHRPQGEFTSNQNLVNSILRDSAKNQLDLMKEFRQEIKQIQDNSLSNTIDDDDDNDDEYEEPQESTSMGLIALIEPLLEKYLPILLGNGPQSKMAIAAVKSMPNFKEALKNPEELSSLVSHIAEKEGIESAKKLIKKLKINTSVLTEDVRNSLK